MRQIFISNFLIITRELRATIDWVISHYTLSQMIWSLYCYYYYWTEYYCLCAGVCPGGEWRSILQYCYASSQTAGCCWSSEDWGSCLRRFSGPEPARSVTARPGGWSRWSCPSPSPGRWPGCACSATGSAWSSSGPTVLPSVDNLHKIFSHYTLKLACYYNSKKRIYIQ